MNEIILTDVCPYSLGVQIVRDMGNGQFEGGYFLPIIERNTPIPVSRAEVLETIEDNQTCIQLEIYQVKAER